MCFSFVRNDCLNRIPIHILKKVTIKNLKGRWGAITKVGGINLNANLIKAPEDVVDYIIIHELCHFIIKGHSHHFWELIRSYFPRYQDAIKWLDVNSSAMLLLPNFYSPNKKVK